MMLLKGDQVRLHDDRVVEIINVWGFARCHAKVKSEDGAVFSIISERDVAEVLRRPAIRKSKFVN